MCCSQVSLVEPEKGMVHCRWLPLWSFLHGRYSGGLSKIDAYPLSLF